MSEKTKTRATLSGSVLTFPKTGFSVDITKVFKGYSGMSEAEKYIVEYGFRQCFQDVTASPAKGLTPKTAQEKRLEVLLAGKRPTKVTVDKVRAIVLQAYVNLLQINGEVMVPVIRSLIGKPAPDGITADEFVYCLETAGLDAEDFIEG